MQEFNIDRIQSRKNSTYPFANGCKLDMGGVTIASGSVLGIALDLEKHVQGTVRIARCDTVPDGSVRLTFAGKSDTIIGSAIFALTQTTPDSYTEVIIDPYGVAVGFIQVAAEFVSAVATALNLNGGFIRTQQNDFIIDVRCLRAACSGVCRSIRDGNSYTVRDTTITGGSFGGVSTTWTLSGDSASASVVSTVSPVATKKYGIKTVVVNGRSVSGCSYILIQHKKLSNARVLTEGGAIQLKGVTYV